MLDKAPNKKLSDLLDRFGAALAAGDIDKAVACFQEDCFWRDLVSFTWNIKTMEGRDQVRDMLVSQLAKTNPSNWRSPGARTPLKTMACSTAGSVSKRLWRAASATSG